MNALRELARVPGFARSVAAAFLMAVAVIVLAVIAGSVPGQLSSLYAGYFHALGLVPGPALSP